MLRKSILHLLCHYTNQHGTIVLYEPLSKIFQDRNVLLSDYRRTPLHSVHRTKKLPFPGSPFRHQTSLSGSVTSDQVVLGMQTFRIRFLHALLGRYATKK